MKKFTSHAYTIFALSIVALSGAISVKAQEQKIGSQTWATQNLSVSQFRNGDPIPEAQTKEEWNEASKNEKAAWCYYDNDPANDKTFGKLYNWFAVADQRGLAPEGWHIATYQEWTTLIDNLGGTLPATNAMKSTNGWNGSANGSNSSGFTALPGGQRANGKLFQYTGSTSCWWSASKSNFLALTDTLHWLFTGNKMGLSVRCVRDGSQLVASRVQIGNNTWATANLNVSAFRNGQEIPQAKTRDEWYAAGYQKTPAWCYYDFDPANGEKYGKLYNWYAMADPRGLTPDGWRMPEYAELEMLAGNLLKRIVADSDAPVTGGTKLKSSSGWNSNSNGSNTTGFAGLPGGTCGESGDFYSVGQAGHWWSTSENGTGSAYSFVLLADGNILKASRGKGSGMSIRCVRLK